AAALLQSTASPVAFPTETVYGLAADATNPDAVAGIYAAKQRPADNPLIVHFADLTQLRSFLREGTAGTPAADPASDPIPAIYRPLLPRFWPGPLTILLPLPPDSPLAPAVTAGQPTFAARIPSSPLARALIAATGRPLAAPSANASTRPSPTTAAHVLADLNGRIAAVLDGGPCGVGVESTVVDGLSSPPAVLRPGGVGIGELRKVPGWEVTVVGYRDGEEGAGGKEVYKPRAPGMKYRHYAPRARVVLFEAPARTLSRIDLGGCARLGVIRTARWEALGDEAGEEMTNEADEEVDAAEPRCRMMTVEERGVEIWDVHLGPDAADVGRGLFGALRALDGCGVEVILVEGIEDGAGDVAAAVMNRLRKAAEVR
ncbi:translation factor, partial [Trichodelitschia bisporula]